MKVPAMFRKEFVSIEFGSKYLKIFKLDSGKKKPVKMSKYEIPAGYIVNYRIQKPNELTLILKKAWKEQKIKEKSVGIVIPEFSTYTKVLILPKLSRSELDEAIRWQSQDFLPVGGSEMIMDWQIINEDKDTLDYQILVAAIEKSVLSSYVEVASRAGLLPLVVETPSLSLTRISDGDDTGKLVIYVSPDETIIVLAEGKKIVASSVASSTSQNEIIQSALRVVNHYKATKITRVVLGGVNLSQEFFNNVANSFKVKVFPLEYKGVSLDSGKLQEYAIALSLQLKNPEQPSDEYSINLLPPVWEKHYRSRLQSIQYWTLSLIISIFIWSYFISVVGVYFALSMKAESLGSSQNVAKTGEAEAVFTNIKDINNIITKASLIGDKTKQPQELINKIESRKVGGISINYYDINFDKSVVSVRGRASDRGTLFAFKQSLEEDADFSEIDLPVSSLVNQTDIEFDLSFGYLPMKEKESQKIKLDI